MGVPRSSRPTLKGALTGRVLGDAREHAGLTQRQAGAKLGMSQSSLADIETGRRPVTVEEAMDFAELYGMPFGILDVRGSDPGRAAVRRTRGRPRKNYFELVNTYRPDDPGKASTRLLQSAERAAGRGEVKQAWSEIGDALGLTFASAGALRGRLPGAREDLLEFIGEFDYDSPVYDLVTWIDSILDGEPDPRWVGHLARLIKTLQMELWRVNTQETQATQATRRKMN